VFEAGFPEDALVPRSPLVDDVDARLQAYAAGRRPRSDEVSGWKAQQVEVFLKRLPRVIPTEDCAYFEDLFKLKSTRNRNIQTEYFVVAIRSGHEPVLAGVDQLLAAVGRMLFLKPLYRALVETTWSRAHAHELFARHRGAYHPIAVRGLELILAAHVA
jgi:leukotriene-A4 hydrolase